jgi:hypothetical protein
MLKDHISPGTGMIYHNQFQTQPPFPLFFSFFYHTNCLVRRYVSMLPAYHHLHIPSICDKQSSIQDSAQASDSICMYLMIS